MPKRDGGAGADEEAKHADGVSRQEHDGQAEPELTGKTDEVLIHPALSHAPAWHVAWRSVDITPRHTRMVQRWLAAQAGARDHVIVSERICVHVRHICVRATYIAHAY